MRIVLINTFFYNGGSTGKIVEGLAKKLKEQGHYPLILYGADRGEGASEDAVRIEKKNVKRFNELKARILGNHGFNNRRATIYAIELIRRFKPDIIHLHNLHGSYINIELLFDFIRENNIKTVWTLHDCWSYTGRCAHYDYNGCSKWKNGCGNCRYKLQYPVSWGIDASSLNFRKKRLLYGNYKNLTIVTPSMWLKDEVKKSFLYDLDIRVINNGVNLSVFKPTDSDIKKKYGIDKMLLAVAYNITLQKGIDYLIKISEELPSDWKLVIIGKIVEAKRSIDNKKILIIPRTYDNKELAKWYSAADVFINPTMEDTFPTVNIEALACGTPCVSYDSGGTSEITDENTGILVKKSDWKSMLKHSMEIDKNALTIDCVGRAHKYFDEMQSYNKYIELYKELLLK